MGKIGHSIHWENERQKQTILAPFSFVEKNTKSGKLRSDLRGVIRPPDLLPGLWLQVAPNTTRRYVCMAEAHAVSRPQFRIGFKFYEKQLNNKYFNTSTQTKETPGRDPVPSRANPVSGRPPAVVGRMPWGQGGLGTQRNSCDPPARIETPPPPK